MSDQEKPEDYYDPALRNYRRVNNKKAREHWFEETEPTTDEGTRPTHRRITSMNRATTIGGAMLAKLSRDCIRCSVYAWKIGTPLPAENNFNQPLAAEP
jgi:hypothetical protein